MDSPREVERWWAERPAHVKDWGVSVFVVAASDYDRLQAEVAALKERLEVLAAEAQAARDGLTDTLLRLEASERDAARYAWIRDRQIEATPITYYSITHKLHFLRGVYGPVQFDDAIDKAIADAALAQSTVTLYTPGEHPLQVPSECVRVNHCEDERGGG